MSQHITKQELLNIKLIDSTPKAESIRKIAIDWLYTELALLQHHDRRKASNTTQLDIAMEEIERINKFIWSVKTSKYKRYASWWCQWDGFKPRQMVEDYHRERELKKEMKARGSSKGSERPDHQVRPGYGQGGGESSPAPV